MNPQKLTLLTKHGKKFAMKTKRGANEEVLNGVYYAPDGHAYVTNRLRLLRLRNVHSSETGAVRGLVSGAVIEGVYPNAHKLFDDVPDESFTLGAVDIPRLIAVTKSIVSIAKSVGERRPTVSIVDGLLTFKYSNSPLVSVSSVVADKGIGHAPIMLAAADLLDALNVFKDAGSAKVSTLIKGTHKPVTLYDNILGIDIILLPFKSPDVN